MGAVGRNHRYQSVAEDDFYVNKMRLRGDLEISNLKGADEALSLQQRGGDCERKRGNRSGVSRKSQGSEQNAHHDEYESWGFHN